jgi:hypothetical protein
MLGFEKTFLGEKKFPHYTQKKRLFCEGIFRNLYKKFIFHLEKVPSLYADFKGKI